MPKFTVSVREVYTADVTVEADSIEDARELASELVESDELETTYSFTMDPDDWPVFEA